VKIIYTPRNTGKTTRLIQECAREGGRIVCSDKRKAYRIECEARKLGCVIPPPLIYHDLLSGQYHGLGIKRLYIDNVDSLVQQISTIPVATITLTSNQDQQLPLILRLCYKILYIKERLVGFFRRQKIKSSKYVKETKETLSTFFLLPSWQESDIRGRRVQMENICRSIRYAANNDKEIEELVDFLWDESCKAILQGTRIDYDKEDLLEWTKKETKKQGKGMVWEI